MNTSSTSKPATHQPAPTTPNQVLPLLLLAPSFPSILAGQTSRHSSMLCLPILTICFGYIPMRVRSARVWKGVAALPGFNNPETDEANKFFDKNKQKKNPGGRADGRRGGRMRVHGGVYRTARAAKIGGARAQIQRKIGGGSAGRRVFVRWCRSWHAA